MSYDIGQQVRLPVTVRDTDGNPIDATMAIAVTKADGTAYLPAPTIVHDAQGQYHADVIPGANQFGIWTWGWTASGAAVGVYTGQFFVRVPGAQIVSLKEVKDQLNKSQAVTTDDEELRDWIAGSRIVIERITGPIIPATFVEFHDGGHPSVYLRRGPVIEVTEVRESWGPGDVRILTPEPPDLVSPTDNDYYVDTERRRIVRRSNGYGGVRFAHGTNNLRVTYRAGRVPVPDNYRMANLELITHLWRASQLAAGRVRPREDVLAEALSPGYAVPNRVRELLGVKRAPRLGR